MRNDVAALVFGVAILLRGVSLAQTPEVAPSGALPIHETARQDHAMELAAAGKLDAAAAELAWLWSNLPRADRSKAAYRHATLAIGMRRLAASNPPARATFVKLRDELTARLDGGKGVPDDRKDWLVLAWVVGDAAPAMQWFDKARSDPAQASLIAYCAFPIEQLLLHEGRWADLTLLHPQPLQDLEQECRTLQWVQKYHGADKHPPGMDHLEEREIAGTLARLYVMLLAAGRTGEAEEFVKVARERMPGPIVPESFASLAWRAGQSLKVHLDWVTDPEQKKAIQAALDAKRLSAGAGTGRRTESR